MSVKYSILIPTHNRKDCLEKALELALGQRYDGEYEVLVCDDGSTDGTWEFLQGINDSRLRIMRNEKNLRGIRTRNRLIRESSGEYIVWYDDDDFIHRDFLKCADSVLSEKEYDIVDFNYSVVDVQGRTMSHPWNYCIHEGENCFPVLFGKKKCGGWILWGKAIRRDIMLKSIPGDIDFYFDDVFYIIPMYFYAKSYLAPETNIPLYQYNYGTGLSFVFGKGVSLDKFKDLVRGKYAAVKYNSDFIRKAGYGENYVSAVKNGQDLNSLLKIIMNIDSYDDRIEAYDYFNSFFNTSIELKENNDCGE